MMDPTAKRAMEHDESIGRSSDVMNTWVELGATVSLCIIPLAGHLSSPASMLKVPLKLEVSMHICVASHCIPHFIFHFSLDSYGDKLSSLTSYPVNRLSFPPKKNSLGA